MKVLVASTIVPFISGGTTVIIDSLERALQLRGHEVDVLRLPFHSSPDNMPQQMLALRLHQVADKGDRLVCIRTPSYLLQHPRKVLWFIHHHRTAYDLWGTDYGDIADSHRGRSQRDLIRAADDVAFQEASAIFTNSQVVSDRLLEFNSIHADVLYPPLDKPEMFRCDGYGDSIVYISRLAGHKRQDLAIEAMRFTRSGVKLIVAGPSNSAAETQRLIDLVDNFDLHDRVDVRVGWIEETEKVRLLAECLAVVYCPFDEDSYGYPSLEAHQSMKAVVSTTDSGGVGELVIDGHNGFLTSPTPRALAKRFDELYEDRVMAEQLGHAGHQRMSDLGISWDSVIDRLLTS